MRLLIIGGTSFIGRHVADQALAAGAEVTVFNRGVTDPTALPWAEHIRGDRTSSADLQALAGRDWDAVVDTCGFDHRVVALSNAVLAGHVGHYTFISSIAVYADPSQVNREDDPLLELDPEELSRPSERSYGGSSLYGPLKVCCERLIAEVFPDSWAAVRPTSVSGPLDHGASNRRTGYWAARVRDYDEILVPRPGDRTVSYIDARDMASWIVGLAGRGATGAFNAAAPNLRFDAFLEAAREVYGSSATAVWADPEWLLEQGVKPNVELPWWVPGEPQLFAVDAGRAVAHGLEIRPIEQTIRDSAEWEDVRPPGVAPQSSLAGQARGALMSREREFELIERWRAREGVGGAGLAGADR